MKPASTFPIQTVLPDWVDYNGHMNVAYYVLAFDRWVDLLFNQLEIGPAQMDVNGGSSFVLEAHINYVREVVENDPLRVEVYLLDYDELRVHYFLEMFHAEQNHLVATSEQLSIYVDLKERRARAMPSSSLAIAEKMLRADQALPDQRYIGRKISINK